MVDNQAYLPIPLSWPDLLEDSPKYFTFDQSVTRRQICALRNQKATTTIRKRVIKSYRMVFIILPYSVSKVV